MLTLLSLWSLYYININISIFIYPENFFSLISSMVQLCNVSPNLFTDTLWDRRLRWRCLLWYMLHLEGNCHKILAFECECYIFIRNTSMVWWSRVCLSERSCYYKLFDLTRSTCTWRVLLQLQVCILGHSAVCGVDVQTFLQHQSKLKDESKKWWWASTQQSP